MARQRPGHKDLTDEDFTPDEAVTVVESWDAVPHFTSEAEAAEWWDTHSLADNLWSKTRRGPPERLAKRAAAERARRGFVVPPASREGPLDSATFFVEIVVAGAAAAVALWLLYELFRSGAVPTGLPRTGAVHLPAGKLRAGTALRALTGAPHRTGAI